MCYIEANYEPPKQTFLEKVGETFGISQPKREPGFFERIGLVKPPERPSFLVRIGLASPPPSAMERTLNTIKDVVEGTLSVMGHLIVEMCKGAAKEIETKNYAESYGWYRPAREMNMFLSDNPSERMRAAWNHPEMAFVNHERLYANRGWW